MNLIVTMAGRGSRFRDAGFDKPKYAIEAKGKTLFEWSLISLKPLFSQITRTIFVTLKEHDSNEFIANQCEAMGLADVRIVSLDTVTDGQATTALSALEECDFDAPVVIYNIDTHINPDSWNISMIPAEAAGWLLCFDAPGAHWSFAKVGSDGWATEVAEKVRISDHASVGLYQFNSARTFSEAYAETFDSGRDLKGLRERYIAPMYNCLIESGDKVAVSVIPFEAVVPLGTPDELRRFLASPYSL